MQRRQIPGEDFGAMVLLDPALLAELHRDGWRGAMSPDAAFALGIAEPVRLDRYAPQARASLAVALKIPILQHLPVPDVLSLQELRPLAKYLSQEERLLLALARSAGHRVAAQDTPIVRHAEKFLGKGRVLSRESLVASAGLQFEAVAIPESDASASEIAALCKLWGDAGQTATGRSRTELHAQGIGFVYKRDGVVVEALPDGTVRPVPESR